MKLDEREDFVDLVAQAVIDRIEERVIQLQKEAAESSESIKSKPDVDTSPGAAGAPDKEEEK